MPPTATPVPVSAVNATSGDAQADAGEAQTSATNTQLSAGQAGGGDGLLSVNNQYSNTITDSSAASAQAGNAVALAPTVGPGTPVPTGVTTSASGHASANGLSAQTDVNNTSLGAVQVAGQNHEDVNLTSRARIDVENTSASAAQSGQAWAVAAGAAGAPSKELTPRPGSGTPTTADQSVTGLTAQTTLDSSVAVTMTVPGGSGTPQPISVARSIVADAEQGGSARAVSAAAGAADAQATGGAANAQGGSAAATGVAGPAGTHARSGSADAQGLTAQNVVDTNANVNVRIGGQNFAPIQVIVDTATRVVNWGLAAAGSGDATAGARGSAAASTDAPSTGAAQTTGAASSGSAQATGAQVRNDVDLRASAAVRVHGDNHNPIEILLDLAANLVNWGAGVARSGDAQTSASGGSGTASSGAAGAQGLQAINLVSMWADASVDIEGDNYAPIFVRINFRTNVENYGAAAATSGNVAAGETTIVSGADVSAAGASLAGSTGSASPSGSTGGAATSAGAVGETSVARGGDVVAIANSIDAVVASTQIGSANGSQPASVSMIRQLLNELPTGSPGQLAHRNLPAANEPDVQPGLQAQSGDSLARGMHSTIVQDNVQIAACAQAGAQCEVSNQARLAVNVRDLPTNPAHPGPDGKPGTDDDKPGPGGVSAGGGCACANATPTPMPTPRPNDDAGADGDDGQASRSDRRGGGGDASGRTRVRAGANIEHVIVSGHVVMVDLFDQFPARRLPPMPTLLERDPSSRSVTADLDGWPGASELPLPGLSIETSAPSASASAPSASAPPRRGVGALSRAPGAGQFDASTGEVERFPMLELVEVDLWSRWPGVAALPVPPQAARPVAVTTAAETDEAQLGAALDQGVSPVGFGLEALLALLLGALAGSPRGRHLLGGLGASIGKGVAAVPQAAAAAVATALGRRVVRGLAVLRLAMSLVRLTLGLFRLWHW